MKKIIIRILKEEREEQFLNKIIKVIKNDYPLFKNMESYGFNLSEEELNYVFSGVFGEPVTRKGSRIYNQNGNQIYREDPNGYWEKREYDDNGNRIYFEDSDGNWYKYEYDDNSNKIYFEDSDGSWVKYEYDGNGNRIYIETSYGYIKDNR